MKMYELDLSEYDVTVAVPKVTSDGKHETVQEQRQYPLKENLAAWLRVGGVFKTGEEICEAITVAKRLLACGDDTFSVDEHEYDIIKKAMNRHIESTHDGNSPAPVGGVIHEEAITRIFGMKEVEK